MSDNENKLAKAGVGWRYLLKRVGLAAKIETPKEVSPHDWNGETPLAVVILAAKRQCFGELSKKQDDDMDNLKVGELGFAAAGHQAWLRSPLP